MQLEAGKCWYHHSTRFNWLIKRYTRWPMTVVNQVVSGTRSSVSFTFSSIAVASSWYTTARWTKLSSCPKSWQKVMISASFCYEQLKEINTFQTSIPLKAVTYSEMWTKHNKTTHGSGSNTYSKSLESCTNWATFLGGRILLDRGFRGQKPFQYLYIYLK